MVASRAQIKEDQKKAIKEDASTVANLIALGRLPFTVEGPMWCLLGNLLWYQSRGSLSGITTLLSCGIVCLTNVSINYANEYFDFEADSILADIADDNGSHGGSKLLVNGTFPRWVALAMAAAVQLFILVCIQLSRTIEGTHSSLQGIVLQFGLGAMFLAQQYVGPPFRLHYNGGGEIISSLEIASMPVLYGYLSQLTATMKRGVTWQESYEATTPTLRFFLLWSFAFELSRIFIMHAADITEDRLAKKHTLVSIVGYRKTKVLFQFISGLAFLFAWNVVVSNPRSILLLGPVYMYSIPIFLRVQDRLEGLCAEGDLSAGKAAFSAMPVLVSLQTLGTPVLLSVITMLAGDCLA